MPLSNENVYAAVVIAAVVFGGDWLIQRRSAKRKGR